MAHIIDMFEEHVMKQPEKIALIYKERKISYLELNKEANLVMFKLKENNIKKQDCIIIKVKKSIELFACVLAIQKLGAIFIPVNKDIKDKMLDIIAKQHNVKVVIEIDENNNINIIQREEKIDNISFYINKDILYIKYNTYEVSEEKYLKGICIKEKSVLNMLECVYEVFYKKDIGTTPFFMEDCFGVFLSSFYVSLCFGGRIVIYDNLYDLLVQKEYVFNVLKVTPTQMKNFIDGWETSDELQKENLKGKIYTFEICNEIVSRYIIESIEKYFGHKTKCYLEFGYVETMSPAIYSKLNDVYNITIGKPIKNIQVYIIGSEISIAGIGVADGYINNKELTDTKFVSNMQYVDNGKIFKTGDMGRYQYDGNIEYIGKRDKQINIEGHKIELNEIEKILMYMDEYIQKAVALLNKGEIWIYVKEKKYMSEVSIKGFLSHNMPSYSIFLHVTIVDDIPLKNDGRVDKEALLKIDPTKKRQDELPKNELQEKLLNIFEKILAVRDLGIKDDFFMLGGQSVKAIALINEIQDVYGIRLKIKDIFENTCIEKLADLIKKIDVKEKTDDNELITKSEFIDNWYNDVSYQQNKILMITRLDELNKYNNKMFYNLEKHTYFEETLELEKVKDILEKLVERHEILRTTFHNKSGKNLQKIHSKGIVKIGRMDDFEYGKLPLFSVEINNNNMILYSNRLIFDEKSVIIFMDEFNELYKGRTLPELKYQYRDYINAYTKERQLLEKMYWNKVFEDGVPSLKWKIEKKSIQQNAQYAEKIIKRFWSEDMIFRLKELQEQSMSTINMVMLSVCSIMLYKYTEQEDMVLGGFVYNRTDKMTENMIGNFQNILLYRFKPSGDIKCKDYFKMVKKTALEAYEHQHYATEHISKCKFSIQIQEEFDLKVGGENKYFKILDLGILILKKRKGYKVLFIYNDKMFKTSIIEKMFEHLEMIIKRIDITGEQRIKDIDILTYEEKARFIYEQKNTICYFDRKKTFCNLFKESVKINASKTALMYNDIKVSYAALDLITDRIAKKLIELQHKKGEVGVVFLEPSIEVFIAIIGILKAGMVYLPIETAFSKDRIEYIINQSKASFVVTKAIYMDKIYFLKENIHVLFVDNIDCTNNIEYIEKFYQKEELDLDIEIKPDDLAYIIYTSGSMGKPKGIMIEHHSLTNMILWTIRYYELSQKDNTITHMNLAFDSLIGELFPPLIAGACIHIPAKDVKNNVYSFINFLENKKISVALLTPSFCEKMMDMYNGNIRKIITGGEKLRLKNYKEKYPISNNYGTTENTVVVTAFEVDKVYNNIPIGKPIDNTFLYIVDKNMMPVPVGVIGELLIGGEGLARGYVDDEELTNEYFIRNPFSEGRLFRTGDLVRWKEDGNIEYIGRDDNQVKINGYRIQLDEIECALKAMEEVSAAVVLKKESSMGEKYICAYVITTKWDSIYKVKTTLLNILPEYIFSQKVVELDEFVMTSDGKIDKEYLQKLNDNIYDEYIEPETDKEKILEKIIVDILCIDKVSVTDGFYQIGGDSVKAMYVVNELVQNGYEISVEDFIRESTVEKIVKKLQIVSNEDKELYVSDNVQTDGIAILMPLQISFFMQKYKDFNNFTSSRMLFSKEGFNKNVIEKSAENLVKHHDVFRSIFINNVQKILPIGERKHFNIEEYDCLVEFTEFEIDIVGKYIGEKCEIMKNNINIEAGILLQLGIFHTLEGDYLMVIIHNLIIDETSWPIVLNDLIYGCKDKRKTTSYITWNMYLQEYINSNMMDRDRKYWMKIAEKSKNGEYIDIFNSANIVKEKIIFKLDEIHTKAIINGIHKKYDTNIRNVLLAAFGYALSEWNGNDENIIMLEGHGRKSFDKLIDVSRTVGCFTSIYPVLLNAENNVISSILKTKEMLKKVPANDISYMFSNVDIYTNLLFVYKGISKGSIGKYDFGEDIARENFVRQNIIVIVEIKDNILEVRIEYIQKDNNSLEIKDLADYYKEWLEKYIEVCQSDRG